MRNTPNEPGAATQTAYLDRVNRAIDLIVADLTRPLKLDDIARAAKLSPFHFHRVFAGVVGETPAAFVKRLRLEKAITIMVHNPGRALTHVALDAGFNSQTDFSRCFKQRFGVPPSVFDANTWRTERRGELDFMLEEHDVHVTRLEPGENPDGFAVTIRDLPAQTMAYLRVLAPYREGVVEGAAERLVGWAKGRGIETNPWYGYMWDDPEVTALDDCRYDVGVEIDPGTGIEPDLDIGRYEFPAMRIACLTLKGDIQLEIRALDWLYRTWLPASGCVPDDLPCFEAWHGLPFQHGNQHFELDLHLPVKTLRP